MWTQVIMQHNGALTGDAIFDEIVPDLFKDVPFFPCYFKSYSKYDEYYLYKNFQALKILMNNNLEYTMTSGKKVNFTLQLNIAKFQEGQIDWFYKLRYVILKRSKDGTVDLSNLMHDPDLKFMKFKFDSKKVTDAILEKMRDIQTFNQLNLQNNNISNLDRFTHVFTCEKLNVLDLRNNNISSLFGVPVSCTVKELLLDSNPIADIYSYPHAYVTEVALRFVNIQWLDGYKVDRLMNMVTLRTFMVKRDAYTFAEEFVKTFFHFYDDDSKRGSIGQFYNESSIFTMSLYCEFERAMYPTNANYSSRVHNYATHFARNVKLIVDMHRLCDKVFVGRAKISEVLSNMPKTSHKLGTFTIDIPVFHPNNMIILTVSGAFEEYGRLLNECKIVFGFTRTFILKPTENNSYTITNDQLFIHGASIPRKDEVTFNLCNPVQPKRFAELCGDLVPSPTEEKKLKLIIFQELTELKEQECLRQLESSFWDLKVALVTFNTLMDSHEIRDNQFNLK